MANYITALRSDAAQAEAREARVREWIADLKTHLQSAKFQGADADGSRRDWIATGDVGRWLANLETALTEV